jgi:hypothetical protein
MMAGLAALLVASAASAAVQAQGAPWTPSPPAPAPGMSKIVWSPDKPALDLGDSRLSLATPYAARSGGVVSPGNKTAIDHKFADSDATGAIGYLCGLKPGPNETAGVASSFDAAGTFLGGQFKLAW